MIYFILLSSLTLHECAHAFVANWLGDPTPRLRGRLTLNPLAHMDPLGTFVFPLITLLVGPPGIIIGWGKPVVIEKAYFKNKVLGDILVSLAGPLSNILIAVCMVLFCGPLIKLYPDISGLITQVMLLNIMLAVFNLFPIPPSDGSHLLKYCLKLSDATYYKMSQWGFFILLGLMQISLVRQCFMTLIYFIFWGIASLAKGLYGIPLSAFFSGRF